MSDDIHVVEQGDRWEVWRQGDSMPLGSYLTLGEAEERAQAQATRDGVAVEEHDRGIEVDPEEPAIEVGEAAPAPSGDGPDPQAAAGQAAGAPSDNDTLVAVLASMRAEGYAADLRPRGDGGEVVCSACGQATPAGLLEEREERRMEGASDPADMVLVVGARCPACRSLGALVLGYGPDASAEDAAVVGRLR